MSDDTVVLSFWAVTVIWQVTIDAKPLVILFVIKSLVLSKLRYLLGVYTSITWNCIMSVYALEGLNTPSWNVPETADFEKDEKKTLLSHLCSFNMVSEFGVFLTKTDIIQTRNCVYETLCPQPLACQPSFSAGNLVTILFQLTKSEATSCNTFRVIFIGSFRCPNLQRALTQKCQGL